jgi:hypothetical protein
MKVTIDRKTGIDLKSDIWLTSCHRRGGTAAESPAGPPHIISKSYMYNNLTSEYCRNRQTGNFISL